jgi:hypothetical protein
MKKALESREGRGSVGGGKIRRRQAPGWRWRRGGGRGAAVGTANPDVVKAAEVTRKNPTARVDSVVLAPGVGDRAGTGFVCLGYRHLLRNG